MKVSCRGRDFCPLWDKKLNRLLDEGELYEQSKHHITIRLKAKRYKTVKRLWGLLPDKEVELFTYDTYSIWTSNKGYTYGQLYYFNGEEIPPHLQKAASEETLQKLFDFEEEVRYPFINLIYGEDL